MKYVSIDLETTGLNPETCQIIEFAAIIEDTNEDTPLNKLPSFQCFVKHEVYQGEAYALQLNQKIFKVLSEDYTNKLQPKIVYAEDLAMAFFNFLKENNFKTAENKTYISINVAGANVASFDLQFLKRLPEWNKLINVRRRTIDPSFLFVNWNKDETLPSLSQCKKRAMFSSDEVSHRALEDAQDVVMLLRTQYKHSTLI